MCKSVLVLSKFLHMLFPHPRSFSQRAKEAKNILFRKGRVRANFLFVRCTGIHP
jgi:hypothetical protein